ncbi:hypothetical protein BN1708_008930 [Verticillium longisporum]|uniref:Uncharacterized protein n=1 Tax=Verticillium longisporum TaxID=100787 RepID=A0A0G4N8Z0_VERLO|nr:hypothetical protein BN1708_008930 [Verticillium longisporum]
MKRLQAARRLDGRRLLDIEAVEVRDLGPRRDKVVDKLLLAVGAAIHFGKGAQLGVGSENEIRTRGSPPLVASLAVATLKELLVAAGSLPCRADVEQVDKEVVGQLAGALGQDAMLGSVVVGVQNAEATDEGGQLRRRQRQKVSTVNKELLSLDAVGRVAVVAEAVGERLEVADGLNVGLLLRGVATARSEGDGDAVAGGRGSLLNSGVTSQNDQVGERHLLATLLSVVEALLHTLEGLQNLGQLGGVVDLPVLLRGEADTSAVGTTTLVAATEGRRSSPGNRDELRGLRSGGEDLLLESGNIALVDQRVVNSGNGVLPQEVFGRNFRAEVASLGAKVTVKELEPGASENIGKLVWVLEETARDLLVLGIEAQGQIGGEHGRAVLLGRVVGIGNDLVIRLGHPLVGASRALGELPLVLEEVLEVLVTPLGRGRGPGDLETAGDGVGTLARLVSVLPAETLSLKRGTFGLGTDLVVGAGAVGLAEGVATSNKSDGLLVVHGHAAKGGADVVGSSNRVGVAIGALGVDVDQTHVGSTERLLQVTGVDALIVALVGDEATRTLVALVATRVADVVAEPSGLATPVDRLVGLPDVGTATGEAKGLEVHRLEGDIAGQEQQISPGNLVAVLLLDGPQQTTSLVERDVVGPAVEGSKTLLALTATTAAVKDAVGTGAVPGHANEETSVVTKVGGPPVLGVGHEVPEVLLDGIVVEAVKGSSIVKVAAEGVRDICVLTENVELQSIGPPVTVAGAAAADIVEAMDGALALRLGHVG